MQLRAVIVSAAVLSFTAGCANKEPTPAPAETSTAPVAPSKVTAPPTLPPPPAPAAAPGTVDRSTDPAFALKKEGDVYIGRVSDTCPNGAVVQTELDIKRDAKRAVDQFNNDKAYADRGFKLVGTKLVMPRHHGGCPKWAGHTIVVGTGSPLPVYLCSDVTHDQCEMDGYSTWSFDLTDALAANKATDVVYAAPTKQAGALHLENVAANALQDFDELPAHAIESCSEYTWSEDLRRCYAASDRYAQTVACNLRWR